MRKRRRGNDIPRRKYFEKEHIRINDFRDKGCSATGLHIRGCRSIMKEEYLGG